MLKQPKIQGKPAPLKDIMIFLKNNRFYPAKFSNGTDGFKNDRYQITDLWKNDGSMRADNVLIDDDNNLYFIDANIAPKN